MLAPFGRGQRAGARQRRLAGLLKDLVIPRIGVALQRVLAGGDGVDDRHWRRPVSRAPTRSRDTHFGTSLAESPSSTTWNAMMLPCVASPLVRAKVTLFEGGPHIGRYTQRSFLALTMVAGAPHTPVEAYDISSLPALSEKSAVR